MSQPAIEVENLAKSYVLNRGRGEAERKTVWVLNDISFKAQQGDVIGIIGKNGAGKSTLLKILARITEPTRGRAIIRGRVASLLEVGTGFHEELSGRENVFMNGTLLGMTPTEVRKSFDEIVAFSGVERYIDQPVKHYSSGMRVRLAFSVAAHLDPEVMFIDEVLSVGDMEFQDRCLKRMNQLTTEFGRTVLFVSHNMNAVATLCPTALLLNQGNCVALGPTGEIIKKYHALVHGKKDKKELAEREDRTGAGGVRFQEVEMQDADGKKIEFARSGAHLRLALRYRFEAGTPMGERINVNVAFNNARGQRLFAAPSDLVAPIGGNIRREGWCFMDIPKLPLMPGRYEIDLAFQVDRLTVDKVTGAAVIPVVEGPFYPTGRLPNSLSGDLLVDYDWGLEPRTRIAQADTTLPAAEDIPDPVQKPLASRLITLAPAINTLEAASKSYLQGDPPLDPLMHERLRTLRSGYVERLGVLKAHLEDGDEAAAKAWRQLDGALERIGRQLADSELPMLLGIEVPRDELGRGLPIDDPRLTTRDEPVANMAELAKPAAAFSSLVTQGMRNWEGWKSQRKAMRLISRRIQPFLRRADDLLATAPTDPAAIDVHAQVTMALKDVVDWAEYLAAAPEDAGSGTESLFRSWQAASAVRELHLSEIFAGIEEVSVPISAINQESAHENQVDLLYVSAIARGIGARRLFEFGTYMGRTTRNLARIAPDAEVWTLNLPPEADPRIAPVLGSYYRGTPEEARIHEIWTNSRTFEPGDLAGTMDLVFVDADHSYPAVVADTERALKLVRPGGVVIWHDYASKSPGVVRFAHDFGKTRPLFRIKHTCLLCLIEGVDAKSFEPAPMRRGLGD